MQRVCRVVSAYGRADVAFAEAAKLRFVHDAITFDAIARVMHRLFIEEERATLRREDNKKARELEGLIARLSRIKKGAHLVDAAAGKSSVGLVAAEMLPIGRLTILERDPKRVAAANAAAKRVRDGVVIDVRQCDVADSRAFPEDVDAVVALHACGAAADLVMSAAVERRARQLFVAPCCPAKSAAVRTRADTFVKGLGFVADDLLRRRIADNVVHLERKLRLEAAGYQADIEEFAAPTITPHNLLFIARRTRSAVRMKRAEDRLAALAASQTIG